MFQKVGGFLHCPEREKNRMVHDDGAEKKVLVCELRKWSNFDLVDLIVSGTAKLFFWSWCWRLWHCMVAESLLSLQEP
jgi:hypothetical protein